MSALLQQLPKIAPLAVRHAAAYVELVAEDGALLTRMALRRLLAGTVALVGAIVTLLTATGWIVAAVWFTPWRGATIAGLLLVFASLTLAAARAATRRWPAAAAPFARLRQEWRSDQALIRELGGAEPALDAGAADGADGAWPQERAVRP